MTIKEIEERTGLTRANIRFYEKEGFLSPARKENGYRDYSDADLTELERIRLLRELDVSLEDIHAVQNGETDLCALLARYLPRLEQEQERIQSAHEVCQQLCRDGAEYQTLDALPYLDALRGGAVTERDQVPRVRAPWQRFFARWMDMMLCVLLFHLFLSPFPGFNLADPGRTDIKFLTTLCSLLLMLFLEPLLLHLFGTTPGKWLLGFRITDQEDRRLSYGNAFIRTLSVLRYGNGFSIPIYSWYRLWKSWKACDEGEVLPWEDDSILTCRETHTPLRLAAGVIFSALLLLAEYGVIYSQTIPHHHGDLTVAEFAENFNDAAVYYGVNDPHSTQALQLSDKLEWQKAQPDFIYDDNDTLPELIPTVEDGQLTGVRFLYDDPGDTFFPSFFALTDLRALVISSFVRGRDLSPAALNASTDLMNRLTEEPLSDFTREISGVRISSHVICSGYHKTAEVLIPIDGREQIFELEFSMELIK